MSSSQATILNVDDNPSGRYVITRTLRHAGFQVKEAATGEEALRLVLEQPDLVLLDINLPDIDGFEVCRRIRSNPKTSSIPVLHLSATSVSTGDRTAGLECADAYLTQPVDPPLLVATIRALLRVRRAENEARAAARSWQVTFDAIGHGVCLIDAEGRVRQANRALCALLGKSPAEVVGQPFDAAPASSREPPEGSPFERARASRRHEEAEIEAGGSWFLITVDPILDEEGRLAGAVRTIVDVTARRRAEQERERLLRQLEDERASLETALAQMPAGVLMAAAPSGKLLLKNDQLEALLRGPVRTGGGSEDYLQYAAWHPKGARYGLADWPLTRTIASGEVVANEEIAIDRGDGSRGTFLVSSTPVRNRDGFIVAAIMTFTDVTDRKQVEDQTRQSQKMEAMGRLAGGVAHDFNNLLTIIGGYGQMVFDALEPKSALRRDMEAIMEAATRATTLTRQLLTFSRRQVVQPRVLDLNRQVSRMNRMLRRVIGEDIDLETALHATSRIKADPAQIEQVLLNVAVNARDAMPKGGRLTIHTENVEVGPESDPAHGGPGPGRYVLLAIADTGVGMDAETQSHLFEPFFTTKGKGKGTGLGLSTVYGIVKQSGGEIVIKSEVGSGTVVNIYLPVSDEVAKALEPVTPELAASTGTETILVVEDEPEVLRLTSEMLARQGYVVLEAGSPSEAQRIWRQRQQDVDLVLSDVIMPQMSGPELVDRLKKTRPDLKAMYMSGYTEDVIARHGVVNVQKVAFLHKPFTLEMLAKTVRSVLDRKPVS